MSDIDKKEETLEAAAETGALDESTAEKLQEIMEKYDRESNVRKYTRKAKVAVRSLLIAFIHAMHPDESGLFVGGAYPAAAVPRLCGCSGISGFPGKEREQAGKPYSLV